MRFYGSAMPMPHIQGAFRQRLVAEAWQCHKVADGVSINEAAFAEPFAVVLHARHPRRVPARQARSRDRLRADRRLGDHGRAAHGAREIVATDVVAAVLEKARQVGADRAINVADAPDQLGAYSANKGYFDVQFEASGNERAVRSGLEVLKPRGILVQLGLGGDVSIPQNIVVAKEIEMRGTFRFHEEFGLAVDLINQKRVDLKPLLTGVFGLDEAVHAFEVAVKIFLHNTD